MPQGAWPVKAGLFFCSGVWCLGLLFEGLPKSCQICFAASASPPEPPQYFQIPFLLSKTA
jgi:hypothetical protein